jgi:proteasome lid subunit RPN8/RPN11
MRHVSDSKHAIRIGGDVLADMAAGAAAAYPNEGCGALLGRVPGGVRSISDALPVPNTETGTPRMRFEVAPRDYMAVEDEADRRGLSLLGFWHSHPDDTARASKTDRAYAWEGLLTVIVSVPRGTPREVIAWEILGPDAPFTRVPIEEDETGRPVTTLSAPTAPPKS